MKKLKYLPFLIPLPVIIFIFLIFQTEGSCDSRNSHEVIIEYEIDGLQNEQRELERLVHELKHENHRRHHETKAFSYDGITEIVVNGKSSTVLISDSNNGTTSFSQEHSGNGNYSLIHEQQGNKLQIWVKTKSNRNSTPLKLEIPNNVSLVVYNTSGDIVLSEINTSKIELKTTSGDIVSKDVNGNISAKSASGDVVMKDVHGNINIITASGSQKIIDTNADMEIFSASGDVIITDSEGVVNVKTASGDIKIHELRIQGDASFESVSGNIDVYFSNYINKLDFDLKSLSGNLQVGHEENEKHLSIQNNSRISVKGRTVSGSQDYQ